MPGVPGGKDPVGLTLCNRNLVAFRTQSGRIGVLEDRCAHRGIRLSLGRVVGERLCCPYHSWAYDCSGCARSPAEPHREAVVDSFSVREEKGYVWIRAETGFPASFPELDFDEFAPFAVMNHPVRAPFRLLMDNMAELEHTTTVHENFGFRLADIGKVKTEVTDGDALEIYYEGPQRPLPAYITLGAGIRGGDRYVQYASIRFGPVHSTYTLWWHDPRTGRRRNFGLRFVIFYNPVTETTCEQHAFIYTHRSFPKWRVRAIKPLLSRVVAREISADIRLVESLRPADADQSRHLLGKFDQPLEIARRRIRKEYFCQEGA